MEGIAEAIEVFGDATGCITISTGRQIPVRWIGEQHLDEDFKGFRPTRADWLKAIRPQPWMNAALRLSRLLEQAEQEEVTG